MLLKNNAEYEEHIGNGYAPCAPDEICVGYIRDHITKQQLADMISDEMKKTITQAPLRRGFSFAVRGTVGGFFAYSCTDSAVTVSADPAGCKASQRRPCTAPRHAHDNGTPSICRTEAAERTEQNTLSKTRQNSKTPQKRL